VRLRFKWNSKSFALYFFRFSGDEDAQRK